MVEIIKNYWKFVPNSETNWTENKLRSILDFIIA